jgi:hypothetical protein
MEQWNNGKIGNPSDTYIPANTPMRNKFSIARASGGKGVTYIGSLQWPEHDHNKVNSPSLTEASCAFKP